FVGIPATIGGALAMNAGTADGWIGDFVSAVYYLHPDGALGEFKPSGEFGYRAFHLPAGAVLIGCRLQLHRRPLPEIQKEIRARLKQKKATQPLALASAGFVWKNPAGELASRLIEKAGLRGKRVNGAEISSKHANFIVNRGAAGAADILGLMELTRERVHSRFGIAGVEVHGASRVPVPRILAAAAIVPGTNLWTLDGGAVAARVSALPEIRRADIVRELPNRVTIVVEERRPFTLVHAGRLHW